VKNISWTAQKKGCLTHPLITHGQCSMIHETWVITRIINVYKK